MSGTVRAGLLFGLGGLLAFFGGLFLPIPCVNIIVAFASLIALGWGAGYTAAKTTNATQDQRTGRGLTAGAIAGLIALIGTVIILVALSGVVMNLPGVREQIAAALQQNPDTATINPDDLGGMLGIGFGAAGFCFGLVNFLLMLMGGLIGGLMWKGAPTTADYVPAGGTQYNQQGYTPSDYGTQPGAYIPPSGAGAQPGQPQQYGGQPQQPTQYGGQYTPPDQDQGGARVYDPNDPNRPQ